MKQYGNDPFIQAFTICMEQGEMDWPLFEMVKHDTLFINQFGLKKVHCKALQAGFSVSTDPSKQFFDSIYLK